MNGVQDQSVPDETLEVLMTDLDVETFSVVNCAKTFMSGKLSCDDAFPIPSKLSSMTISALTDSAKKQCMDEYLDGVYKNYSLS